MQCSDAHRIPWSGFSDFYQEDSFSIAWLWSGYGISWQIFTRDLPEVFKTDNHALRKPLHLFCLGRGLACRAERQGQREPAQQLTLADSRSTFISSTGVSVRTLLKTIHFLGLSLFLGSIVSYVVIGIVVDSSAAQAFSRTYVLTGTTWVTIPALWVLGLTGIMLSGIPGALWQKVKIIGFVLVALNTHVFILPAISNSVYFLKQGEQDMLEQALHTEAVAGFVNLALTITLMVVAVGKLRAARRAGQYPERS
ncbi:hypothetical protein [Verminephrobacter aporrectodeae]|uniref:hypothetical protein n=1 Tax=Verminephrobacter aporrectodeae TaxID=1110389 RepID=UPI002243B753|nr:hypothetical protein [Verminephrobacter aporrectodeae]